MTLRHVNTCSILRTMLIVFLFKENVYSQSVGGFSKKGGYKIVKCFQQTTPLYLYYLLQFILVHPLDRAYIYGQVGISYGGFIAPNPQ